MSFSEKLVSALSLSCEDIAGKITASINAELGYHEPEYSGLESAREHHIAGAKATKRAQIRSSVAPTKAKPPFVALTRTERLIANIGSVVCSPCPGVNSIYSTGSIGNSIPVIFQPGIGPIT